MKRREVLVVDDDQLMRQYLTHFLSSAGYKVECSVSGNDAIARLSSGQSPDLILLDLKMPGMDGLEVLAHFKKLKPALPIVILSGSGQVKTVVEAIKLGATDYLTKPFEDQELELTIENALEKQQLREEVRVLRRQLAEADQEFSISGSPRMLRIREIARQVADTDVPVLILGESGVGKEVLARFVVDQSSRRKHPFVKVNCAALPHDLLESELFGYERGAFTGALSEKPGKFELAGKGTILLDEIGEMSLHLQAKLLHILQDSEYTRLGGKHPIHAEARVLASTNRKIEELVAKGEFREDLYFRLNVISIEIPPLRERREDIPILCKSFIAKYREKYRSSVEQLPGKLLEAFVQFDWPGNIRQLENAVKRYLILQDLDLAFAELKMNLEPPKMAAPSVAPPAQPTHLKDLGAKAAELAEREVVLQVLTQTHWNRKQAAQLLDISYKALRVKLKKWNLGEPGRVSEVPAASQEERGSVTSPTRLLFSNVPLDCSTDHLKQWIEEWGYPVLSVTLFQDVISGTSPSFAHVELSDAEHLDKAGRALDGQALRGHTLRVIGWRTQSG
jgi:two-component system response regulator AtoC